MKTTETHSPLNLTTLIALETICRAAQTCARVRWIDDNHPDGINEGTARHLVKSADDIGFLGADDDVRDCVLRITTTAGWEVFLPVMDLVALVKEGGFALDG